MAIDWSSPLGPAVLLLFGALLMWLFGPHLVAQLRYFLALLIPVAVVPILLVPGFLSKRSDMPVILSTWGLGESLAMRADRLSLVFLFLVLLLLLVIVLMQGQRVSLPRGQLPLALALGAAASLVLVAANRLTVGYTLLVFDVLGFVFWLRRERVKLATARLLLSLITTSALALNGLAGSGSYAALGLGFAFWLRLGLYPFVEAGLGSTTDNPGQDNSGRLLWFGLSIAVGIYLPARVPLGSALPGLLTGLVVAVMMLNGLLAWLADQQTALAVRLALTQASLALLIGPLSPSLAGALASTVTPALVVFWLSPRLGRPRLAERYWPWLYAAPALATASILGLPFTSGWVTHSEIYALLAERGHGNVMAAAVLAEGVALAALWHYWSDLLRPSESNVVASAASLVAAVPFLVPGLALVILEALSNQALGVRPELPAVIWLAMAGLWLTTVFLAAGRRRWLNSIVGPAGQLAPILDLGWAFAGLGRGLDYVARRMLRFRLAVEGEHYLGWLVLLALTGVLVVLLR
jgi:hypothetical protein